MTTGIYLIFCLPSERYYVGSAVNIKQRWHAHRSMLRRNNHDNRHLQRAWAKYGEAAFSWHVLEECSKSELLLHEQLWIVTLKAVGPDGMNCAATAGSQLGFRHSAETRLRMRHAQLGRKYPQKGRPKTEAEKERLRIQSTGRTLSAEARAKISAAKKGKPRLPETRAKVSASKKGKSNGPQSPEWVAKRVAAYKRAVAARRATSASNS